MLEFDLKGLAELEDAFIAIELAKHNASQPGIRYHAKTSPAGRSSNINLPAFEPHAIACGLNDGVGLGVHSPHAVTALHHVPLFITMGQTPNRAIVARGQNHLVANNHRTHMLSGTSRPRRDLSRDVHEVFVPTGPRLRSDCHGIETYQKYSLRFRQKTRRKGPALFQCSLTSEKARGFLSAMSLLRTLLSLAAGFVLATTAQASRHEDRPRAERLLTAVEQDPAHRRLAAEPLASSRRALRRADEARAGGDNEHAGLLEALGHEWAASANDLVRAAKAERKLANQQTRLDKAETKLVRSRSLLEATVARRDRARAKLKALKQTAAGGKP